MKTNHKTSHKTIVACAYADVIDQLSPTYYGMLDDLVRNVREVLPGIEFVQISNDKARKVKGINGILRIDVNEPLMVWRLKAHQYAHSLADQVIFVEPDVRFKENVLDVFDDPDFDVAITKREIEVNWAGEKLSLRAPYTLGCTFSRSDEFWRQAKLECQKLEEADQNWVGDMIAMAITANSGAFKVKLMEGPVYNHVPNERDEVFTPAKVLHFKGKRKQWLFPKAVEAA